MVLTFTAALTSRMAQLDHGVAETNRFDVYRSPDQSYRAT
jgi:hypothetical protein